MATNLEAILVRRNVTTGAIQARKAGKAEAGWEDGYLTGRRYTQGDPVVPTPIVLVRRHQQSGQITYRRRGTTPKGWMNGWVGADGEFHDGNPEGYDDRKGLAGLNAKATVAAAPAKVTAAPPVATAIPATTRRRKQALETLRAALAAEALAEAALSDAQKARRAAELGVERAANS